MWIDLTKDCLCTPLLFLKGMIFPLGLWYSLFSIVQKIFAIREMSYSIPCPFPHQRGFFSPFHLPLCISASASSFAVIQGSQALKSMFCPAEHPCSCPASLPPSAGHWGFFLFWDKDDATSYKMEEGKGCLQSTQTSQREERGQMGCMHLYCSWSVSFLR